MGLFIVILANFAFFGPVTLEKAKELCAPESISKECYVQALEPITYRTEYND